MNDMTRMSTQPIFPYTTTAEEVATAFSDEIQGQNVLITGTSLNGLGFETTRVIAKYANFVLKTGCNKERLKFPFWFNLRKPADDRIRLSEDAIKKDIPTANIHRLTLDLSCFASIRRAAQVINYIPEPLHMRSSVYSFRAPKILPQALINNAAASFVDFKITEDGPETQLATDHVGPFLFTKLLAPKLIQLSVELLLAWNILWKLSLRFAA
ncbi:hypothetical protein K438DRAFT_1973483 [Mycena galopus ATCC 62051]|nr:hypothetical protein K438DRAFT_1973483 [Mycena galopus ATCC 62051]